jgi:hypothetical protein
MPLDIGNTEVAKTASQLPIQPPLLEAPVPTMPTTTAIVVPLELPQVQQSTEVVHSPCAVLDIQGNDTGHLRSSTASISKEGKKVDVTDMTSTPASAFDATYHCQPVIPWLSCHLS